MAVALDGGGSDGGGEATHHGGAFQCGGVGGVFAWRIRCVALRCGGRGGGGGEAQTSAARFKRLLLAS